MPHIDDFKLPGPFNSGESNDHDQQKILTWKWVDPAWYFDHGVGESGWQYGTLNWTDWGISTASPQPTLEGEMVSKGYTHRILD